MDWRERGEAHHTDYAAAAKERALEGSLPRLSMCGSRPAHRNLIEAVYIFGRASHVLIVVAYLCRPRSALHPLFPPSIPLSPHKS